MSEEFLQSTGHAIPGDAVVLRVHRGRVGSAAGTNFVIVVVHSCG